MITNLPEDIQKSIYNDYIKPDMIIIELNKILKSEESKKLNHIPLYLFLSNVVFKNDVVFNNEIVIKNLLSNDKIFKIVYEQHIIKKENTFVNFKDSINSMALSWLMYLYH